MNAMTTNLIENFNALNGTKWVGIKGYKSVKTGEVANFVVNANFNYGRAVDKSITILESLTASDFDAIVTKYGCNNEAGTVYGTNAGAKAYLESNKFPKAETKARITAINGLHITKTVATVCAEMVSQMNANKDPETRSKQSQAQRDKYTHVAKSVKRHVETKKLHIWAMANWKEVLEDGVYAETSLGIEAKQKNAIERYCKSVLSQELPVTKYRNFAIEETQLSEVVVTGNTYQFA
jgi:hypothetical protein